MIQINDPVREFESKISHIFHNMIGARDIFKSCQTSKMRSLSKLINSIQSLIAFAKRFTLDFRQSCDTPLDVQLSITSANHMAQ